MDQDNNGTVALATTHVGEILQARLRTPRLHQRRHTAWALVLTFVLAFGLLISRRPDAVVNAQFWAEDGAAWYSGAYQDGARTLLRPQQGYFQTVSRITALAACKIVPFRRAPLFFNLVALSFQALVVVFLLSSRLAALAGFRARLLLSLIYLALPNTDEVHANITNTHWHLALLAVLVLFASAPRRWAGRFFDLAIVALSSISGPFSLLIAPMSWSLWWMRRSPHRVPGLGATGQNRRWTAVLASLSSAGAAANALAMLQTSTSERISNSLTTLGAGPYAFLQVLGRQVFLGSLIGIHGLRRVSLHSAESKIMVLAVAMLGITAFLYALAKANIEVRLLVLFGYCIFILAMFRPMAIFNGTLIWVAMQYPGTGGRYWFLPMIAFAAVLVWMAARASHRALRAIAVAALLMMAWGSLRDWHHQRFVDLHFQQYAVQFERAPSATQLRIPLNPPGFFMVLQKH